METMIPPQVGMRLRTKERKRRKRGKKKKKKKKKKKRKKKNEKNNKREKGQCYFLFLYLCFKVAPCFSYRESPELSLSYTSGNFSL